MKFLTLDDTPDTYATAAGKGLKVSGDEVALEFTTMKPDNHHARHEAAAQDQVDHGGLAGLADNDHPQYILTTKIGVTVQAHSAALDAINATIINAVYPVGSIYASIIATNPGTVFGVGTWAAFGAGKVPVGFNAAESEFDVVEETGGAKTHVLTEGELAAHLHAVDPPNTNTGNFDTNHGHYYNTGGASVNHTHQIPAMASEGTDGNIVWGSGQGRLTNWGASTPSGGQSVDHYHGGLTNDQNAEHRHPVDIASFDSGSKGSNTPHNNLPPYIVVYMWKRTA